MSRQKPSIKLSSTYLDDEALKKLLEPLGEDTEQSISGGGRRDVGLLQLHAPHGRILGLYVHNDT